MGFKVEATESGSQNYERIGEGTTVAIVAQLIDFGTQHRTDWKTHKPQYFSVDENNKRIKNGSEYAMQDEPNDFPDMKHIVFITFELPSKTIDVDGVEKPRWISKEITVSAHEKSTMRKWNAAIMGADSPAIDLEMWLGQGCLVQIGSTSGDKDKIVSITPMIDGMETPELFNGTKVFSISDPDMKLFNSLPQFMKDKIENSQEWTHQAKKVTTSKAAPAKAEDDNPF